MMRSDFPGVRLRDVIAALEKQGRHDEAEYHRLVIAIELGLHHGVKEEEVLDMKVDRIFRMMQLPDAPEGWDNWFYGRAALANNIG